ncbi:MAG TPA: hypothetical protein VJ742_01160 [Nitrososphaera sp.]|nr:hypothetical protein [Nitrososphaera sp.]
MLTCCQMNIILAPVDEDGHPCAPEVTVWIDYVKDVDRSYGEDADGRQGIPVVQYDILDSYVDAADLKRLTEQQAISVLEDAEIVFRQRAKHF